MKPTRYPTTEPSVKPTRFPTCKPSVVPSVIPSAQPTVAPTSPTESPTLPQPSVSPVPTTFPTVSMEPSESPTSSTPTVAPSFVPSTFPTVYPTTTYPTFTPSTIVPTMTPSSTEFYNSHPKATLPSNVSISVIGYDSFNFKIVLPYFTIFSGSNGKVFSDVNVSGGTIGTSFVVYGNQMRDSSVALTLGVNSYFNTIGLDAAKRTVSVIPDFNGDSYDDVIIGDPYAARCYVMFGNSDGLINMNSGFTIFGEKEGDLTGWSVSGAGDVNNDTIVDIIIGAPMTNKVGAVYVIFGAQTMTDVYLNNLTSSIGFAFYGARKSDYLGVSVSNAGDVNGDGYDDILASGMITASYYAGATYIVYGGRTMHSLSSMNLLTLSQGFKATGTAYMYTGFSISKAGDVNGDGYDDVLIGSAPTKVNVAQCSYLIFGNASMTTNLALESLFPEQGVRIIGGGMFVGFVGDVNNDTLSDVMVSSAVDINNQFGYIVYSSVSKLNVLTASPVLRPTIKPTVAPTAGPSVKPTWEPFGQPTMKPIGAPSFLPTSPTYQPVMSNAVPTLQPSNEPTIITFEPSVEPSEHPSVSPSLEPSEAPSLAPSLEPTESPSCIPSDFPTDAPLSVAPSKAPISRNPVAIPTILPTFTITLPEVTEFRIHGEFVESIFNHSALHGNFNYVVNASGFIGIDPIKGQCSYIIIPNKYSTITIFDFNVSASIIDLSSFGKFSNINDLDIRAGSILIYLSEFQIIHIIGLQPSDITEDNFKFFQLEDASTPILDFILRILKYALPVACLMIVIVMSYQIYLWMSKNVQIEWKNRLLVEYVVTIEQDKTLIGITVDSVTGNVSEVIDVYLQRYLPVEGDSSVVISSESKSDEIPIGFDIILCKSESMIEDDDDNGEEEVPEDFEVSFSDSSDHVE